MPTARSSHPLDPLRAPLRSVERGAEDECVLEDLALAELGDRRDVPRAGVAWVQSGEEARIHVAGAGDPQQRANGRGPPAVLAPGDSQPLLGLRQASRP